MAANAIRALRALIGGSAGAGAVTSLGLSFWSATNASWLSGDFAQSTLALMLVSAIACFVGASTMGLAWHTWMQSKRWTNAHVYWAPGAVAGALVPIAILIPGLIANRGTDATATSLLMILATWGAALGGLTGLFAWLIRRPDRDAPNPATRTA